MPVCDVSVVVPAYNAASFIVEALDSIARQSHLPKEVLVINDGSTDQTYQLVQQWITHATPEFQVHLFDQQNRGLPATRNVGIEHAQANWIALLDADDVWEPGHLEALFDCAARAPDAVLVYGAGKLLVDGSVSPVLYDDYWDNHSQVFGRKFDDSGCLELDTSMFGRMMRGNFIKPSSLMFKRQTAAEIGLFDANLRTGEDREFLIRLMFRGKFVYTPTFITQYRWHSENITSPRNAKRNMENGLRVFSKVMSNPALPLSPDQLSDCHHELLAAAKGYLYVCAQAGWRAYAAGLAMVYRLFGARLVMRAMRPKDMVRSAIS